MKIKKLLIAYLILSFATFQAQANTQKLVGTSALAIGSMSLHCNSSRRLNTNRRCSSHWCSRCSNTHR
ncbi:exported hypothetical protein [Gammaproteobacteria bacterium]